MGWKLKFLDQWKKCNKNENFEAFLDNSIHLFLNSKLFPLFDYKRYLKENNDVVTNWCKKSKIDNSICRFHVFNHFILFGRNEERKAFIEDNETERFVEFNYELYNKNCEDTYLLDIDSELEAYRHYFHSLVKISYFEIINKSFFDENNINNEFQQYLLNEWNLFNPWEYNKEQNINVNAKSSFIHYIKNIILKEHFVLLLCPYSKINSQPQIDMIKNQNFKDWEMIIFDTNYDKQDDRLLLKKYDNKCVFTFGLDYFKNNAQYTHFTWIYTSLYYFPNYLEKLVTNSLFSISLFNISNKINTFSFLLPFNNNTQNNSLKKKYYTRNEQYSYCCAFLWNRNGIETIRRDNTYSENFDQELLFRSFQEIETCNIHHESSCLVYTTPQIITSLQEKRNLTLNKYQDFYKNKIIGKQQVNTIEEVLEDIKKCNEHVIIGNGTSVLLRIKNEETTIKQAILSIINYVDEVIVVDNNSTDNTKAIIFKLEQQNKKIKYYEYNIHIPKVGNDHKKAVESGSMNTFGTYYNWCLAKATKRYCIKWDGDFIGIENNIEKLINTYNLKTNTAKLSIWFSGASLFYNKYLNLNSWYDEFRVITKTSEAKWNNYNGCETIIEYVWSSNELYIFPEKINIKKNSLTQHYLYSDDLLNYKKQSPLLFLENKNYKDLKNNKTMLDKRDKLDNYFIEKYKNSYFPVQVASNSYHFLIIIPSLSTGGGNYWAEILIDHFHYFGWKVTLCLLDYDIQSKFYDFDNTPIIRFHPKMNFDPYTHILNTIHLNMDISHIKHKLFGFTHSDVSWVNEFMYNKLDHIICLNNTTIQKFKNNGFKKNLYLLNNYMQPALNVSNRIFNKNNIKILYCNRITWDKNTIMSLYCLKDLSKHYNINVTFLAGGHDYSSSEYLMIKHTIKELKLESIVELLPTQKDTSSFYNNDYDFCYLTSINEGCSYGILEAINHEIPIVTTFNLPNNEIIKKSLPCFEYKNNINLLSKSFCITDYSDLIENLGYISFEYLLKHSNKCQCIYKNYVNIFKNIKFSFVTPNEILELIKDCKCENPFSPELMTTIKNKEIIFNKNKDEMFGSFKDMIDKYPAYKKNVKRLKKTIEPIYYSKEFTRKQLLSIFTNYEGVYKNDL